MIVKITFEDLKKERWTMLFGNNYKKWQDHFEDYLYNRTSWWDGKIIIKCDLYKIVKLESCSSKWIASGGLKWCSEQVVDEQLGIEQELLEMKNPRKYSDFNFEEDIKKLNFCIKKLDERLRHLKNASAAQILTELEINNENLAQERRLRINNK